MQAPLATQYQPHRAAQKHRNCTRPNLHAEQSTYIRCKDHVVRSSAGPSQATDAANNLVERRFTSNWRSPLPGHDHPDPKCRPVIALGKFDALHKGHQALAAAAQQLQGSPVLLSFSGMGAVLGWAPRKPLVAPCDRPRVLDLWAQQLNPAAKPQQQQQQDNGNSNGVQQAQQHDGLHDTNNQQQEQLLPIRQHYIPFSEIRSMSPEDFVKLIVNDLKASGVVAGSNYRFGYRAAGDSALLHELCSSAGLAVSIVELVGPAEAGATGVVSSSKIREMLSARRIEAVRKSLGRRYRLVSTLNLLPPTQEQQQSQADSSSKQSMQTGVQAERAVSTADSSYGHQQQQHQTDVVQGAGVLVPQSNFLNQHPGPGVYLCDVQLLLGATAHDDLLQIQRALDSIPGIRSSSSSGGGGGSVGSDGSTEDGNGDVRVFQGLSVTGSQCFAAITGRNQRVQIDDAGLMLPNGIMQAAHGLQQWSVSNGSSLSNFGGVNSNVGKLDYSRSRSSSSVGGQQAAGLDPLCWDTDDIDDSIEDGAPSISALLVVDLERCLVQMCSVVPT